MNYENKSYLMHHGIEGQQWGVSNGPPYPLDAEDHSSSEKTKGTTGWTKKAKKQLFGSHTNVTSDSDRDHKNKSANSYYKTASSGGGVATLIKNAIGYKTGVYEAITFDKVKMKQDEWVKCSKGADGEWKADAYRVRSECTVESLRNNMNKYKASASKDYMDNLNTMVGGINVDTDGNSRYDAYEEAYEKLEEAAEAYENGEITYEEYYSIYSDYLNASSGANNCVKCSTSILLKLKGFDGFKAGEADNGYVDSEIENLWNNAELKTSSTPMSGTISDMFKDYPEGDYGYLDCQGQCGGHSMVYYIQNGNVILMDGQTGKTYECTGDETVYEAIASMENVRPEIIEISWQEAQTMSVKNTYPNWTNMASQSMVSCTDSKSTYTKKNADGNWNANATVEVDTYNDIFSKETSNEYVASKFINQIDNLSYSDIFKKG